MSKLVTFDEFDVFDILVFWIKEREKIREEKERGNTKPWTQDEILQTYRFCNVRRMDDRVSKWLMDNWYAPHKHHPNMIYAVGIARFVNYPDTLEHLTDLVFARKISFEKIKTKLREVRDRVGKIFNSAYMVRGNNGVDKIESVIDYNVRNLDKRMVNNCSMEHTHRAIMKGYGFGSFMAGQITADLRWAVDGLWSDKNSWAPKGPGSHRGMNRLLGRPLLAPMKQEVFETLLSELIADLRIKLPSRITERLESMDYQNCLCELDKYMRVLQGEGRPKSYYPGI